MDASAPSDALEEVVESFLARFRDGERPSVEEYAARYPELADQVRELLPALVMVEQNLSLGGQTGIAVGNGASNAGLIRRHLGDYLILREIGRGGMGVVYEAVQQSLGRHVALKVLPWSTTGSATHLERFKLEARAAARLHHTNIVPVFGVGEHEGTHYFAMQYIRGQGLDEIVEELRQLRSKRSASVAAMPVPLKAQAQSVAEGLLTGRFTRALRPAWGQIEATATAPEPTRNGRTPSLDAAAETEGILQAGRIEPVEPPSVLSSHSELTAPEALYFRGVARVALQVAEALAYAHDQGFLHRDIKPSNLMIDAHGTVWVTDFGLAKAEGSDGPTQTGDILGTLRYMAPERFAGHSDARSDLYGLGATLYELLTLQPMFDETSRERLIERVLHREPAAPRKLDARIPRDLEVICRKCLSKEPSGRYGSLEELTAELRRFLDGEPIQARPINKLERSWRWCRRNPAQAVLAATAAALLVAVVGSATVAAVQFRLIAHQAERLKNEAENKAVTEARAKEKLENSLYFHRIALAHQELSADNLGRGQELLDDCPLEMRGWEWDYLKRLSRVEPLIIRGNAKELHGVAFSRDGRRLASAHEDGTIGLFDAESGERLRTLHGHKASVFSVAFHPDGKQLASASTDGTVKIWDLTTGEEAFSHAGLARDNMESESTAGVTFSPDGRHLAYGGGARDIVIRDVAGDREPIHLSGHELFASSVAFSPDGLHLVSASFRGILRFWDALTGRLVRKIPGHYGPISGVAFRPDGRCLATAGYDRLVKVWDAATGEPIRTLRGHTGLVSGVSYSRDGRRLASGGEDKTIKLWDADTGQEVLNLRGHSSMCNCVTFSSDGRRLATAGADATIRIWDATPLKGDEGQESLTLRHDQEVWSVGFSPDGQRLASGCYGNTVKLWDATSGVLIHALAISGGFHVAFSPPDGQYLAAIAPSVDRVAAVQVWDTTTGQEVLSIPDISRPFCLAFSPDGRSFLTEGPNHRVRFRDARTGHDMGILGRHAGDIWSLAFSPDGRRVASAGFGFVNVWDATGPHQEREPLFEIPLRVIGFGERVTFSRDGRHLVTAGEDHTVKIWDANNGHEIRTLRGHSGDVFCVASSPDGRWLASAGEDTTVRLWDATTGELVHTLRGHTGLVSSLAFSPDSQRLVSGSRDRTLKVWDLARLSKKPRS